MITYLPNSQDLRKLTTQRQTPMVPYQPNRSTTVIKEFQVDDVVSDSDAVEKLKQMSNNQVDQDVLDLLNNADDLSDFDDDIEDDFVDLADAPNDNAVITGDMDLFKQFLNKDVVEQLDNRTAARDTKLTDCFNSLSAIRAPINDISERINFEDVSRERYTDLI